MTDEQCAACDFNKPGKTCLRNMEWVWRGEHYSATSAEYNSIKAQLASESFPPAAAGGPVRSGRNVRTLQSFSAGCWSMRTASYCMELNAAWLLSDESAVMQHQALSAH